MKKKTIIIDLRLGNINSLTNCIDSLEFKYEIVKSPDENIIFDKIIFLEWDRIVMRWKV